MDGTHGTYVCDESFDIHDNDNDTDHDTDDDTDDDTDNETKDETEGETEDGGRGNRRPLPDLVLARMSIREEIRTWYQDCPNLQSKIYHFI